MSDPVTTLRDQIGGSEMIRDLEDREATVGSFRTELARAEKTHGITPSYQPAEWPSRAADRISRPGWQPLPDGAGQVAPVAPMLDRTDPTVAAARSAIRADIARLEAGPLDGDAGVSRPLVAFYAIGSALIGLLILAAVMIGGSGTADAATRNHGVVSFCEHGNRVYYVSNKNGVALAAIKGDLSCRTDTLPAPKPHGPIDGDRNR